MSEKLPQIGKISPLFFQEKILPYLNLNSENVIQSPGPGADFTALKIGDEKLLIISMDPLYILQELGLTDAAWFGLHILLADVFVSGVNPQHITLDFNLPPGITDEAFQTIWSTITKECKLWGIDILAGHTGIYEGANFPMIGAGTVFAIGNPEEVINIHDANPGDQIIAINPPGVEAAACLAKIDFRAVSDFFLQSNLNPDELFHLLSVGPACEFLRKQGGKKIGVTRLHDAAEGGLLKALVEICGATDTQLELDVADLQMEGLSSQILKYYALDPLTSSSQGTLVAALNRTSASWIIESLQDEGFLTQSLGVLKPAEKGAGGVWYCENWYDNNTPIIDPFWSVFSPILEKRRNQ